jgi:hypothetical protein
MTTRTTAHPRADEVMRVLARQTDTGRHISEAEIGRELGLEPTEVGGILRGLTTSSEVVRTVAGNWELTEAAKLATKPRPHPREPRAG